MSQEALAEAVGVQRPTISTWERGLHEPTATNLEDLARTLRTTVEALRSGQVEYEIRSAPAGAVRERAGRFVGPPASKQRTLVPPRAYDLIYDYCRLLEDAEVPEEQIEEARRLMSGETFNTLRAHMLRDRDEDGWVKDVKAAWAFIKDQLQSQGFDL